jgi:hypothetical protein
VFIRGVFFLLSQAIAPDGSAGYGRARAQLTGDVPTTNNDKTSVQRRRVQRRLKLTDDLNDDNDVDVDDGIEIDNNKQQMFDGCYFARSTPRQFALCDFAMRTLFDCVGVAGVLRLHAALLSEAKVSARVSVD